MCGVGSGPAAAWQLIVGGSSFLGGYRGFGRGGLLVFLGYLLSLVAEGSGGRWFWQLMVRVGFVDSRSSSPEGKGARAGVGSRRMFRVVWRAGLRFGRPGSGYWWYVPGASSRSGPLGSGAGSHTERRSGYRTAV